MKNRIYEIDNINIVKQDLTDCLNVNIHGVIHGTNRKILSRLNESQKKKIVDSLIAYMTAYELKFDSILGELCHALGWQGGTIHQVIGEIKRLKNKDKENICETAKNVWEEGKR